MQLLVDVGNSRIKWSFYDGHQLRDSSVVSHRGVNFDRLLHQIWRDLECPSCVFVANVAGSEIQISLTSWIETTWHQQPIFLETSSHAFDVTNGYQNPQTLGLDRWLGIIAGYHLFDGDSPVCVIDCGTSLTMDVVDTKGQHMGGLLLPGVHSMRQALCTYTDGCQLKPQPDDHESKIQSLLARNTQDAMVGGTLFAAVAYVERFLSEMQMELSLPLKIVLTGGEAELLCKLLKEPCEYHPHLVLEGMMFFAKDAQKADWGNCHGKSTDVVTFVS